MNGKFTVDINGIIYTAEYIDGVLMKIKKETLAGNIYKVKVRAIKGSFAFCDTVDGTCCISIEGLPPRDVRLDKGFSPQKLMCGDILMCQIVHDKGEIKEMGASSIIAISDDLVVMVSREGTHFSKKIPFGIREELDYLTLGNDSGMGVLFRTACLDATMEEIETAVKRQVLTAKELLKTYKNAQAGDCIYRQNTVVLSDIATISKEKIKSDILSALTKRIDMKNGSFLVIEKTEGMTVIDINSGRSTLSPEKINEDSVEEIKRQLILKDISGLVAIDFLKTKDKTFYGLLSASLSGFADVSELNSHGVVTLAITRREK